MMTDPIADMLTRIRNANAIERPVVEMPATKLKVAVAKVRGEGGYLPRTWARLEIDRLLADDAVKHKPRVIVYDIAPPYENNWLLFRHIRAMPVMKDVHFVLTSTNVKHVEDLAKGNEQRIYEIVGKPFDLAEIVAAVREALKARPTR